MGQPDDALKVANDVRNRRAGLKRRVGQGADVAPTISDPPEWAARMLVRDLLCARPGWGVWRANRAMRKAGVPLAARLGGLTVRQRIALADVLTPPESTSTMGV